MKKFLECEIYVLRQQDINPFHQDRLLVTRCKKSRRRQLIHLNNSISVLNSTMNVSMAKLPHQLSDSSCFTMCPEMDLVSFQLSDTVIWIYRQGNEKVWDIDVSSIVEDDQRPEKLIQLVWKPDGKKFAIASNNGTIHVYSSMHGGLIRNLKLNTEISCLSWFTCNINEYKKKMGLDGVAGICDTFDIINSMPALKTSNKPNSLHTKKKGTEHKNSSKSFAGLKFMDDDDDDIENDNDEKSDLLDVILVGSKNGSLSCIFDNIFVIDDITINNNFNDSKIVEIIPNKALTHQYVLCETDKMISLSKISTEFIFNDKILNKVVMISSRLLNVILYFKKTTKKLDSKYKLYMDYTIRIIELLRGEITEDEENNVPDENNIKFESNNTDPIYDLYDLLLTGSLSNATKKWLTDYLSDRGIKRWSQLGNNYFSSARITIYNHIISSLHHLFIYLTDLKGITQYNVNRSFDYEVQINDCINVCQSYLKYAYQFMIELKENEQHFEQTIVWLSTILSEITTDEKTSVAFKTNDITKFLIFVSSKLNSIDNPETDNDVVQNESGAENDYSKINKFTNVLELKLNDLFAKVKRDIREQIAIERCVEMTKQPGQLENLKFKTTEKYGYLYSTSKNFYITMQKFELETLHSQIFEFKINTVLNIIDIEMIRDDMFIVLYEDIAILYQVSYSDKSVKIVSNYMFNQVYKSDDGSKFKSGYLTVNETRRSFCVLDQERKEYLWMHF